MPNLKNIALFALLTLSQVHADMAGGEASLGIFNHAPSGNASYRGTSSSLDDTLGFNEEQDLFFKAYLEHPLPLAPNVKIGHTTLSHNGSNSVEGFTWGDIVNFTGEIDNSLLLDITDIVLYYELIDNWIEADTGVAARYITGDMRVSTDIDNDAVDFSIWIPMLYGKARLSFPFTDISLQLEANAISYGGLTSYDYELSARYTLAMGIGLEAGYKAFHLDSDELLDGFRADMDFSGPYAAAIWDF